VGVKRHAEAPDGRAWTVQLVWWPRPTQAAVASDALAGGRGRGGAGPLFGLVFDAVAIVVWPLVLAVRVLLRRPWLVEAFVLDFRAEGAAWRVRGLGAARESVDAIAREIAAGNRSPAPPGASAAPFRVKLEKAKSSLNL
jgi:hypothetical protein